MSEPALTYKKGRSSHDSVWNGLEFFTGAGVYKPVRQRLRIT